MTPQDALQRFWNERYAGVDYAYGTAPNDFLVAMLPPLPAGAAVLCLADGEGRNGAWLAGRGLAVTSVDVAEQGLAKARALASRAGVPLTTVHADVTTHALGSACWDAIVSIFLHLPAAPRRALHRRCAEALKPGGWFLFECYGPGQRARGTGGPKDTALLPALDEVLADFDGLAGLRIVHRHAGVRPVHEGTLHHGDAEVVQLVLQRAG